MRVDGGDEEFFLEWGGKMEALWHSAGEWAEGEGGKVGGRKGGQDEVSVAVGIICVFMFLRLSPAQPSMTGWPGSLPDLLVSQACCNNNKQQTRAKSLLVHRPL